MEDLSTLIWIGIAIVWFLTRLVRRGAKKAASTQKSRPRQRAPRPTASPEPQPERFERRPDFSGRGGTGPPPIVPR